MTTFSGIDCGAVLNADMFQRTIVVTIVVFCLRWCNESKGVLMLPVMVLQQGSPERFLTLVGIWTYSVCDSATQSRNERFAGRAAAGVDFAAGFTFAAGFAAAFASAGCCAATASAGAAMPGLEGRASEAGAAGDAAAAGPARAACGEAAGPPAVPGRKLSRALRCGTGAGALACLRARTSARAHAYEGHMAVVCMPSYAAHMTYVAGSCHGHSELQARASKLCLNVPQNLLAQN